MVRTSPGRTKKGRQHSIRSVGHAASIAVITKELPVCLVIPPERYRQPAVLCDGELSCLHPVTVLLQYDAHLSPQSYPLAVRWRQTLVLSPLPNDRIHHALTGAVTPDPNLLFWVSVFARFTAEVGAVCLGNQQPHDKSGGTHGGDVLK